MRYARSARRPVAPALLVLATALVGLVAVPALPGELVVRWTVGPSVQYGPRTLPRLPGVLLVPAVAAVAVTLLRGLLGVESVDAALEEDRWVVETALTGVAAALFAVQVALVGLNL